MYALQQTDTASTPSYAIKRTLYAGKPARNASANNPFLTETLDEISDCINLNENWDGEGALPIASETVSMARNLVTQVAIEVGLQKEWITPSVSPDPNGHLHLLWRMKSHRLLLIVDGKNPKEEVVSVVTTPGAKPVREVISFREAVQRVLSALPTK